MKPYLVLFEEYEMAATDCWYCHSSVYGEKKELKIYGDQDHDLVEYFCPVCGEWRQTFRGAIHFFKYKKEEVTE